MLSAGEMRKEFENKVVVVTGAGGGLGKAYASLFAALGAKVVVNDFGTTTSGEGHSTKAADIVCQQIKSAGGIAVANYELGRKWKVDNKNCNRFVWEIDVLINNAG